MIDGSSHAALKRLFELFPPEANTDSAFYVLLDCTEDKSALAELHSLFFELEACGLFDKSCGQDMADKGPLLVRIPFDGRAREWMARDDVLRGTAMFLFSPLDFPKLCLHLKALLKCGTEYGQRLLFRFYDDNILYAALEGGFRPAFHMLAAFDAVALNIVDARNIRKWVLIRNEMPPEALPAGPVRGAERLYMERLRAYEEWKASRGGRCWAWDEKKKCESDFTYNDGAAYTGLRDEFAGFDKEFAAYRNTFFRDYFALCAALKRVTEVWYTLLHSTLAHSFRGVMADCLRVEDTFARMLEGTPSPLLTLRDLTFYHAHEFLTTFPCLPVSPDNELLWRKCQDVQQSFYDDLTTRLFRKDDDPGYLDFFCSVLGTGNHPTMAAADLMTVVLPYAMHQPVNQKNPLLLAARMRIGLDCVQAKRSWLQLANDCELLGTPSAALGGAVLAFAFLGMVALFGAGLFIYLSTRDNGVEKFLKNCLWNIHARPSNRALRELWVPCDGGVEIHPLWRKWIDRTGEHMRAFFPSRLTCRYAPDKDELVVHFEAPCGSGPECALGLTLTCLIHPIEGESPARAELTERYLIEIPRDVKGNGIYRFKARYHVVPLIMQLKKKRELPPLYRLPSPYRAKAQSSAVGEEDLSFVYAKVNVALRYRFSSDIDYGKVEEVISIPNEVPRAVIKNSLKQWGL